MRRRAWIEFAELAGENGVSNPDGLVAKLRSEGLQHPDETKYPWWHDRAGRPETEPEFQSGRRWLVEQLKAIAAKHAGKDDPPLAYGYWRLGKPRVRLSELGVTILAAEPGRADSTWLFSDMLQTIDQIRESYRRDFGDPAGRFVPEETIRHMLEDAHKASALAAGATAKDLAEFGNERKERP